MANDSRHFRQLQKHTGELNSIVKRALLYVKEQKENASEPKLLHGEKRSAVQLSRKYCQGGGKKPDDVCYQICIYCKHTFVDEVPENKKVFEKNRLKEQKHEELKKQFEGFKNGERNPPPNWSEWKGNSEQIASNKKGIADSPVPLLSNTMCTGELRRRINM